AIEDAGVLAQQLMLAATSGSARAIPDALKTYASLRAARVLRVQQAARANGRSFHFQGPLAFIRDLMIRRLDGEAMRRRYSWLYDWRLQDQL
ncbi:MAG: FAD-dependent monooxygenase, partial [Bosea sp. (in: a-proteobacteria)]